MSVKNPQMIVRPNLRSPDIIISAEESLKTTLSSLLKQITDPSSLYHIDSEYLLKRLMDCAKHALEQDYNSRNCPIIFDSWSCWTSTPPGTLHREHCPNFVKLGFRADRLAEKECTEDGEWWIHPVTNR